jgi:ribosomal protein S18 acetylase RimI-like enzyme
VATAEYLRGIRFARISLYSGAWQAYISDLQDVTTRSAIGLLLVAEVELEAAGTIAYLGPRSHRTPFTPVGFALIRVLAVPPRWRRRGIGRQLTRACIAKASQDRCTGIALQTNSVMVAARRLYADLGFRHIGTSLHPIGLPLETHLLAFTPD